MDGSILHGSNLHRFTLVLVPIVFFWAISPLCLGDDSLKEKKGSLEIYPKRFEISAKRSRVQLISLSNVNGLSVDVNHQAEFNSSDEKVAVVKEGYVTATGNGRAIITATYQGKQAASEIIVKNFEAPDPISFRHETQAILTKQGCNAGSCHGSPQGKGGFELSLFAYDPAIDMRSLTRAGFNRRTNVYDPDQSLILKKPLLQIPHVGGKKLHKSKLAYQVLRSWIYEGTKDDTNASSKCVKVEVYPQPYRDSGGRILQAPVFRQQLSVHAHFENGTVKDVTRLATFDTSNKRVATADANGLVTGSERGLAAINVRYLEHLESVEFTVIRNVPNFTWKAVPENNFIDTLVNERLRLLQFQAAETCSDSEFLRRVYLDLTGLMPSPDVAKQFLNDDHPNKRAEVIDRLLDSIEFARFQALRVADLLKVNPSVLKDGRAELFANWISDSIHHGQSFDQMTTEILTSSGDTKKIAPANFFASTTSAEDLAEATAQVFMGARIQCAKCHNHPFENWTQNDYYQIGAVFKRVKHDKGMVQLMDEGEMHHPTSGQVMQPWGLKLSTEPTDSDVNSELTTDRRLAFVEWLTDPNNRFFARVEVNRTWAHLLGQGIVEPIDDFRSSNPPSNAKLLDRLAAEFCKSGFDRKELFRLICNSQTYQRSSKTSRWNQDDDRLFSRVRVRLLSAEQLSDAIGQLCGSLPATKDMNDGSQSKFETQRLVPRQNDFLKAFGQPKRESTCACERSGEPTLEQALRMLNGKLVNQRIDQAVDGLQKLSDVEAMHQLYLSAYCRPARNSEMQFLKAHLAGSGDRKQAIRDIVWAIVNTEEFIFQH